MSTMPLATTLSRPARLRLALKLDAAVTGLNGAAYLVAAGPLADLFGLKAGPLRAVGAFLLVFAAAVALIATRPSIPRAGVTFVIEANIAWVIASLAVAIFGWSSPETVGTIWIVLQAAVVAGFAALQFSSR
jgi:hypothetical protein